MIIGILSTKKTFYSTRRILKCIGERGHTPQFIDPLKCQILVNGNMRRIVYGGKILEGKGYFYPPTIVEVKEALYEEFFAPVILIKSCKRDSNPRQNLLITGGAHQNAPVYNYPVHHPNKGLLGLDLSEDSPIHLHVLS